MAERDLETPPSGFKQNDDVRQGSMPPAQGNIWFMTHQTHMKSATWKQVDYDLSIYMKKTKLTSVNFRWRCRLFTHTPTTQLNICALTTPCREHNAEMTTDIGISPLECGLVYLF